MIGKTRIILTLFDKAYILIKSHSRGDSGALYLQSATAGVMFGPGYSGDRLPIISGVDVWVSRNGSLRTVSG